MRLQRMLMTLQYYDYAIVHLPSKEMHLTDTLSRAFLPNKEAATVFDSVNALIVSDLTEPELRELQESTNSDDQLCQLRNVVRRGWPGCMSTSSHTILGL